MKTTLDNNRIDDLRAAYKAVKAAKDAVARCSPNRRDYVCHNRFEQAQLEHQQRMNSLVQVAMELTNEAVQIQKG